MLKKFTFPLAAAITLAAPAAMAQSNGTQTFGNYMGSVPTGTVQNNSIIPLVNANNTGTYNTYRTTPALLFSGFLGGNNTWSGTNNFTGPFQVNGVTVQGSILSSVNPPGTLPCTGSPSVSTFLRGDCTWANIGSLGGLTIGTTTVSGAPNGTILFNNNGILGDLATIPAATMLPLANNNVYQGNGSSQPAAVTLSAAIDAAIGSVQGNLLFRNSTSWVTLAPGSNGQFLESLGAASNIQWASPAFSMVVGATTITSGTSSRIEYNNAGVLGEYAISGTGSVCMTTNCVMTTPTLGAATATTVNGNTLTTGTWTATGAAGKTLTWNNTLTLAGTDGTTMTFPSTNANVAALNLTDQTLSGGANLTSASNATGNVTVDCGKNPSQYIVNGGSYTITAPSNDGQCVVFVRNNASAGATSFSGFTVGTNTGASLTTTSGNRFSLFIWRVTDLTGSTAGYNIFAHQ